MRLLHVIATRPNFVKMAPVIAALRDVDPGGRHVLVHTGQHYDRNMSEIFLEELGVPEPDHMLGVGGGTHAEQLAGVLERLAPVLEAEQPDLVIVPGDVNSTLAAALACAHLQIPVAHVEAGLRSFDRTMPEEVNRVLIDQVSELLFTHSPEALGNLAREGIDPGRVELVGNTMIDTLVALEDRFRERGAAAGLGLEPGSYLLVTLHRPALVDGDLLVPALDGPGRGRRRDAGRLPGPPAHPPADRGARGRGRGAAAAAGLQPDRAGRLPRLPLAAGGRRGRAHRLRRHPGGDDVPRRALLHAARQHRAADHDRGRHQHAARPRSGADRRAARSCSRRPRAPAAEPPPLWDGRAAERLAAVVRERFGD